MRGRTDLITHFSKRLSQRSYKVEISLPYKLVCCCGLVAVRHVSDTFIKTDEILLKPKGGFFGAMSERGIGGSKCGATCALALVLKVFIKSPTPIACPSDDICGAIRLMTLMLHAPALSCARSMRSHHGWKATPCPPAPQPPPAGQEALESPGEASEVGSAMVWDGRMCRTAGRGKCCQPTWVMRVSFWFAVPTAFSSARTTCPTSALAVPCHVIPATEGPQHDLLTHVLTSDHSPLLQSCVREATGLATVIVT